MRYRISIGALAVALGLCQPTVASATVELKPVPDAARLQAYVSLRALQRLTTEQTYKRLGFRSPDEAKSATLGTPLRVFMVRLDKLREYATNRDPTDLLEDTNKVRYSVNVGGEVRSSVVVHEVNGQWQIEAVGRPELTKALATATNKYTEAGATYGEPQFYVTIPALSLFLLGHLRGTELALTSATDDERFNLVAGRTVSAKDLLELLVPYARRLETGPRIAD